MILRKRFYSWQCCSSLSAVAEGHAMAVFDASNLVQNVLSAQEAIRHTQNQIQALTNQLNQYKRMLQDAMNPGQFAWGDIQSTIDQLRAYPNRPRALIFRPAVNLRR